MGPTIRVGVGRSPDPDDDDIVEVLETADDIVIVGAAQLDEDVGDLLETSEAPDVVLLDLTTPEVDALVLTRRIALEHPSVGIVVLSPSRDRDDVDRAVQAGARGYVVKPADRDELLDTVRRVAAGGSGIGGTADASPRWDLAAAHPSTTRSRDALLSERQAEVLVLAASSCTDEEIADRLAITRGTVKRYVRRICDRLGVPDRDAAVAQALAWGYVLARGRDSYAIWDVDRPGQPIVSYPEVARMQAWLRWLALCSDRAAGGQARSGLRRLFRR